MKKGFTLIELAMVLIVVGLLMGGAFQMMKVMGEKARSTEAKQKLEAVKEAVIAFAINNNRLPTQVEFTAMNFRDAGDTTLSYYFPTATTPANFLTNDLCLNTVTGFSTQVTNPDGTLGTITPQIAFVLSINGANMRQETILGGNPNPLIFPLWDTAITIGVDTRGYDDFHTQVTLAELQSTIECKPFKIINTSLPNGKEGQTYTASIATTYPATSFTISPPTILSSHNINFDTLTGVFTGTPDMNTSHGTYAFDINASDAQGHSNMQRFAITINP